MNQSAELFTKFLEVIAELRKPDTGCPWDLEQTNESLRPYLIEESYEVLEAIDAGNDRELAAELGDVLLQVVLHAQVAKDRGSFTIDNVIQHVSDKMIRRHPHVFGDRSVGSSAEVLKNWEEIKKKERGDTSEKDNKKPSTLDGIPKQMSALLVAQRIGEKAASVGFDWHATADVWEKVLEESVELKAEIDAPDQQSPERRKALQHELGDLLFSLCQLSRHLNLSAEDALRIGSQRFINRFQQMEESSTKPLKDYTFEELHTLWLVAKENSLKEE